MHTSLPISAPSVPVRFWRAAILMPLLVAFIATAAMARADIKLSLDAKDGDKISDVTNIVAHATSSDNIDKVEFVVDDQLKYTATGVPYAYAWDTIPDTEGKHTLIVTAYDGNGGTKKEMVSLEIDNSLGDGGAAIARIAQSKLAANDIPAALRFARRSNKAEPNNIGAARVIAGIAARNDDLDTAISTLEKAKTLDTDPAAIDQLVRYKTEHAWKPENAGTFFTELDAIDSLRRKAGELNVASVTKSITGTADTPAGHIALGDALLQAGRTADANIEYAKAGTGEATPVANIAHLALSSVLLGDTTEAIRLARMEQVAKKDDQAIRAVYALALLQLHKFKEARAMVAQDVTGLYGAAEVIAAYADAVLQKPREAYAEAQAAVKLLPHSGDAQYALSMSTPRLNDQEDALIAAIARSPFSSGPYLDMGVRRSLQNYQDRYERGIKFAQFVLKADPTNISARLIEALLYIQTKQINLAEPLLGTLVHKYMSEPDILEAVSLFYDAKGIPTNANLYSTAARNADEERFNFTFPPSPTELLQVLYRKYRYRGEFFLSPGSLYPPAPAAK